MTNSADPDQLSSEANLFGSTLYANARYIRIQQDQCENQFRIQLIGSTLFAKAGYTRVQQGQG